MSNDIEKRLKGEQVHKTGPRGEALFCMTNVYQFILAVAAAAAFGDSWSAAVAAAASAITAASAAATAVAAAAATSTATSTAATTVIAAAATTVVATSTITTIPSTSTNSKATHILYSPFLLVCTISYGTRRQSVTVFLS